MNHLSFKVQCYVLVPAIFTGFTALGVLLTYQLLRNPKAFGFEQTWPLFTTGGLLIVTAFLTGILIIRVLLNPIERFINQASRLVPPPLEPVQPGSETNGASSDCLFAPTLARITEVLGNVEARALFPDVIAPSPEMRAVLSLVLKIAPSDSTVLLLGESGTGKELLARSIHAHSPRASKPFVAVNCAGIPEPLLESELFGHEKGAFTGAYSRKPGKFEVAAGGTLFLDEIGDMPLVTQAKILRALQEREIERVGGTQPIPIDIRIIAATNRNLARMVADQQFREDLFFRIDVFSVRLPPLRERCEDIPLLATHFLRQRKPQASLTPNALAVLTAHPWPGNVRELRNVIEAAATLAGNIIEPHHLKINDHAPDTWQARAVGNLDTRLAAMEKAMIIEALERCDGVQVRAAEVLGIKERSLWHRIAKHRIDVASIREQKEGHAFAVPQRV